MRNLPSIVLLVLLTTWFLPAAALSGEPLKVGVAVPLSGEYGALGEAAGEAIAWAGSVLEQDYELIWRDTGGTPDGAARAIRELEGEGVVAILGPIGARESAEAAEEAARMGIPLLTMTSADNIQIVGETVFRLRVSPEDQSRAMAMVAVHELGLSRAAIFYPSDEYGQSCAEAFAAAFSSEGGEVRAVEGYDPDESTPDDEAELLTGKKVRSLRRSDRHPEVRERSRGRAYGDLDALFIPDSGAHVARALAFLQFAGLDLESGQIQLIGTGSWVGGGLGNAEGLAAGGLVPRVFDPSISQSVEDHVASFHSAFEREPTEMDAQVHDGMLALMNALQRCTATGGASDVKERRQCALQGLRSGTRTEGVAGPLHFTREGAPVRELLIFDVDGNGELWPTW